MDILWHLQLRWQPQPAWLPCLQMGTVELHKTACHLVLASVQMVLLYHLQPLSLPMPLAMVSFWVREYLPMMAEDKHQMAQLSDQTSVPMDLPWHLHLHQLLCTNKKGKTVSCPYAAYPNTSEQRTLWCSNQLLGYGNICAELPATPRNRVPFVPGVSQNGDSGTKPNSLLGRV